MVLTPTTEIVPVEPANIPEELKSNPRWCVWRPTLNEQGKLTKKPFLSRNPKQPFSKTTPSHFARWEETLDAYLQGSVSGVGYVCGEGIVALDYDECCDEQFGTIRDDVRQIIDRLNTYAEYSPSGRGVRLFLHGELSGKNINNQKLGVEAYDDGGYVTVTGRLVDGVERDILNGNEFLAELERQNEESRKPKAPRKPAKPKRPTKPARRTTLTDDEVVTRIRKSKSGPKFDALWSGNWEGQYPTQSEAEMALANLIAFWAGRDGHAQIERLMMQSGLNREKWEETRGEGRTYLSLTVDKAVETLDTFYGDDNGNATTGGGVTIPEGKPAGPAGPTNLLDDSTLTDTGLARRLALKGAGVIAYQEDQGRWLGYNGKHWQADNGSMAAEVQKAIGDDLWHEWVDAPPERRGRRDIHKFLCAAASNRTIRGAIALAQSEPALKTTSEQFDAQHHLFNVANGTLDLDAIRLMPHKASDRITHLSNIEFDPNACCPQWRQFVSDVMGGDEHLVRFLQKSAGILLTGDVSEQKLWMHYGDGANGKSTFLKTLETVLSTYAATAAPDMLVHKHNRSRDAENQYAILEGKRFLAAIEQDEGVRLSEATIKQLTGGDTVTARHLYGRPFTIQPTWKIHMAVNHKPVVKGNDNGIWRRVMVIPWEEQFTGSRADRNLSKKLLAELPGILNWCVAGYAQWKAEGLQPPEKVLLATTAYQHESDTVRQWISEDCTSSPDLFSESRCLYQWYCRWCELGNERPVSHKMFGQQLDRLGYRSERPSSGPYRKKTIRHGLTLRTPERDQQEEDEAWDGSHEDQAVHTF